MIFEGELWLPVVGYEGLYDVSNLGRVRGLDRFRSDGIPCKGRILRPGPQRKGYLTVALCDAAGRPRSARVHQLVLAAFVGPCPVGMDVLHRNDIPGDNRLANLYYGTPSQNAQEARRNRRMTINAAPACPCGHLFTADEAVYRDPNNGLRSCAECRSTWRERHAIYAA